MHMHHTHEKLETRKSKGGSKGSAWDGSAWDGSAWDGSAWDGRAQNGG